MEILVAGLLVLAVLGGTVRGFVVGNPDVATAATVFCGVFVQALPFLALGVVISGLIAAYVSPDRLARWLPRRTGVAILTAGVGVRRCRGASAGQFRWPAGCLEMLTAPRAADRVRPR